MSLHDWLLFSSIALVATITPGPAVLLVSSHSIQLGVRYSIATILGNISGLFIMSLSAILGLSALILYSATAFFTIKILGALYLIYLGIKLWKNGFGLPKTGDATPTPQIKTHQLTKCYVQGILVALSNPKAIVFTTALFPQFIDTSGALFLQFTVLVTTFMTLSFSCLLAYAFLAHKTHQQGQKLKRLSHIEKFFGGAFILSGVALASSSQR